MQEKGKSRADWTVEIANLSQVLTILGEVSKTQSDKMSVDLSVVELWERVFHASSFHDVTFKTADGAVTANNLVLSQASPVLAAMLSSTMREGTEKCIEVKDVSSKGATFFLELLYTGMTCSDIEDIGSAAALSALDLAHRWQVTNVVGMTARALESLLTDETFASIAEAGALKGISELKEACMAFAAGSSIVKQQVKDGKLPQVVLELLGERAGSKHDSKRRRTF